MNKLNEIELKDACRTETLTPIDFAVFRHVWSLPPSWKQKLNILSFKRTTSKLLLSKLIIPFDVSGKEWRDFIIHNYIHYEVIYVDCNYEQLDSRRDFPLLLSFRSLMKKNFHVCLVRDASEMERWETYKEAF